MTADHIPDAGKMVALHDIIAAIPNGVTLPHIVDTVNHHSGDFRHSIGDIIRALVRAGFSSGYDRRKWSRNRKPSFCKTEVHDHTKCRRQLHDMTPENTLVSNGVRRCRLCRRVSNRRAENRAMSRIRCAS